MTNTERDAAAVETLGAALCAVARAKRDHQRAIDRDPDGLGIDPAVEAARLAGAVAHNHVVDLSWMIHAYAGAKRADAVRAEANRYRNASLLCAGWNTETVAALLTY